MRTIGTPGEFLDSALFYNDWKKGMRRRRSQMHFIKGCEYLKAEHQYQLVRGTSPFGKPVTMTGGEARKRNRKFERDFIDSSDPKARMWKYLWIKPE